MKRITGLLTIFFCCLFFLQFSALATGSANIGGNDISADNEKYQSVPVYIRDNPGIMGYKITVTYPEGSEIKDISRGTICAKGSFDTTLENHEKNIIEVVWSNTENVKEDGSLFVLSIKVPEKTVGKEIKLSYSQEDTFNESWQDVALFCTGISIVTVEQLQENKEFSDTISDKDYDYIKNIIETEAENIKSKDLMQFDKKQQAKLVEAVSDQLNGLEIKNFSDVIDLYNKSKQNEFESTVATMIEPERIKSIIQESLHENGFKDINEVDQKSKNKICKDVLERIAKEYPELDESIKSLDDELIFESIKKIFSTSEQLSQSQESTHKSHLITSIVIGLVVILVVLTTVIISTKRKRKSPADENNRE